MSELGPYPEPTPLEEFMSQAGVILKWVGAIVAGIFLARVFQGNGPFRLFFTAAAFCASMSLWVKAMRFVWDDQVGDSRPPVIDDYWFMSFIALLGLVAPVVATGLAWMVAS